MLRPHHLQRSVCGLYGTCFLQSGECMFDLGRMERYLRSLPPIDVCMVTLLYPIEQPMGVSVDNLD